MKRIEFFGAIGSGKSTLHTRLIEDKKNDVFNNAKGEIYSILLNEIKNTSFLRYYLLKLILYTPLKNRVFSNYDFYHYLKDDEGVERLLNSIFNELNVLELTDKAKTLVRLNYLLKDLTDVLVLKKYSQKNMIIHDESIIQRGLSFAIDGSLNNYEFFFDNCILPYGVIYTTSSLDVLFQRVSSRGKVKNGFYGKKIHPREEIEKSLFFSERIASILIKKGVKVLKIQTEDQIEKDTEQIKGWIKGLNNK